MKAFHLLRAALVVAVALSLASGVHAQNITVNGDFEGDWVEIPLGDVAEGWTHWSSQIPLSPGSGGSVGDPSFWELPGNDGTADPGNNYQRVIGGSIKTANMRGGIYQVVDTVPGQTYELSADLKWFVGPPNNEAKAYIGYDVNPAATPDPVATTVLYTALEQTPHKDVWNHYVVRFIATGPKTAIYLRAEIPSPSSLIYLDIDNVFCEPVSEPPIGIVAGPVAEQIDASTFRITWETDVLSDSTVQFTSGSMGTDFGLVYSNSANDPTLTTLHSVDITGLSIDQVIQYRVLSSATGYRTVNSLNRSFSTPPEAVQFTNPSFEDVIDADPGAGRLNQAPPWRKFLEAGDGRDPAWLDGIFGPNPSPGLMFSITPSDGAYYAGSVAGQSTKNGGFYQRVIATPGEVYTFSADIVTLAGGSQDKSDCQVWLGIDPNGGVDHEAASIVWKVDNWSVNYPPYPPEWVRVNVSAAANTNAITLFIRFYHKWALPFNLTLADNTSLSFPVEVQSIGQARSMNNGALVDIVNDSIVSLIPQTESGYFYAQDPERSGGIRVNADPTDLVVGDRVKLKGLIATDANGERQLTNATFTETPGGGPLPVPVIMTNKSMGGEGYTGADTPATSYGLDNGGLLVKVYGVVTDANFIDAFWIDDGSNVDAQHAFSGIKVVNSDAFPSVGDYVAVVGVVKSEIVNGKKIRVLRGREMQFAGDFVTLNP